MRRRINSKETIKYETYRRISYAANIYGQYMQSEL